MKKQGREGFTLPEVVITSVLIMVMMVPLSRMAYLTIHSTRYARDVGSALAAGQQQMERLADEEYEDIRDGSEVVGNYEVEWTVEENDPVKQVRMVVSWEIRGRVYDIDLNTVFIDEVPRGYQR